MIKTPLDLQIISAAYLGSHSYDAVMQYGRKINVMAQWLFSVEHYGRSGYLHNKNVAYIRDHFVYAPNQWETMLHCNIMSHWFGAYTKWFLYIHQCTTWSWSMHCDIEGCHLNAIWMSTVVSVGLNVDERKIWRAEMAINVWNLLCLSISFFIFIWLACEMGHMGLMHAF